MWRFFRYLEISFMYILILWIQNIPAILDSVIILDTENKPFFSTLSLDN